MSIEPGPVDPSSPTEPAVAPAAVTLEQFMQHQTQVSQGFAAMTESLQALRAELARGPAAPPPPPADLVTPEQYAQAVQTGDAAVIDRYVEQKLARYHAAQVAPLQRDGAQIIGDLQREVASKSLPYYDRFRKEIDETFAQMPPNVRTQSGAIKIAHDLVAGRHVGEIAAEARETALRTQAQTNAGSEPGSGSGRAVRTGDVPSAEELFGRDTAKALGSMSEDTFARSMGYKDWPAYVAVYREQVAAGEAR